MANFQQSKSPLVLPAITTDYNNSNQIGTYGDPNNKGVITTTKELKSLFNTHKFTPFPQGVPDPTTGYAQQGSSTLHNDDVYDISASKLIEFTSAYPAMALKASDFAYLKDFGVYPNNRIMIARRFPAPIGNDLTAVTSKETRPLATLIGWVGNDNDFLDITFGEEYVTAKASFEEILNSIGNDVGLSSDNRPGLKGLGAAAAGGFSLIPLPGLTEGLQQKLFEALGIANKSTNDLLLPIADPNLIREAMQRKTLSKGEAGSGLKTDFKIKMTVKYEQKYINGVDPTLVYYDIIANVLSFATSDSRFMFNEAFATGTSDVLKNLIAGNIKALQDAISKFITALTDEVNHLIDNFNLNALKKQSTTAKSTGQDKSAPSLINTVVKNTLGAIIGKYKEAIKGVIASLTGVPSTPWHITIGNPQRPVFSSGDLWMDNVKMTLGPVLSYNDLPSSIEIEFELKNARTLGAQEIFNRFNTGRARTYQRNPDFSSGNSSQVIVGTDDTQKQQNTSFGAANVSAKDNTNNSSGNTQNIGNNQNNVPGTGTNTTQTNFVSQGQTNTKLISPSASTP